MEFLIFIGIVIFFLWICGAFDGNSTHTTSNHSSTNNRRLNTGFSSAHTHTSYQKPNHVYQNTDKLRAEFEQFKTTETYKKWRKAQYNCQNGQCAWCKCHLDLHSPYTQTDHIKPLCQGGSPTDLDNLVLACKSCNYWYKKGNYTWRDRNGTVHNGWSKPSWIRNNPVNAEQAEDYSESNSYDLSEIPF